MKPFVVRLFGESSIKLTRPLDFTISDTLIKLRDLATEAEPESVPPEETWEYTLFIDANTPIGAINRAEAYVRYINDLMVFSEGAAIGDPRPVIAIDLDTGSADRTFAQPLYPETSSMRSRRRLEVNRFREFYSLNLDKVADRRSRRRMERGLHLYRRSFLEPDPVDRFEDLWVALEALNPLIRDKYATHRNYEETCPHCGRPMRCASCKSLFERVDSTSGIRFVVRELLAKEDEWSHLRKTRVGILHALEDAVELGPELRTRVDLL